MYGVSEQLMKRMERRMKEKIYREMIEEEQKYKRQLKYRPDREVQQSRLKTQPNYEQTNEEDRDPTPYLRQESSFLPIIQPRNSSETESRNPEYNSYIKRRRNREEQEEGVPNQRRLSTGVTQQQQRKRNEKGEESEQETQQYLSQCEQIISNLRQITKKNKQRMRTKTERPEERYAGKNKSFSALDETNQSLPPRFKNFSTIPAYEATSSNNSFRIKTPYPKLSSSSYFNEFDEENDGIKQRVNFKRLSPPAEDPPAKKQPKINKPLQAKKEKVRAKQNLRRLSPIKTQEKEQEKEQEQQKEEENEEKEQGQATKKSSANEQSKRQKAIVKYLKKARLRGNLLYQKVQSRKPQQQNEPNETGQPNQGSNVPNEGGQPNQGNEPSGGNNGAPKEQQNNKNISTK